MHCLWISIHFSLGWDFFFMIQLDIWRFYRRFFAELSIEYLILWHFNIFHSCNSMEITKFPITCSSKRDNMQLAHSPGFCVAIFYPHPHFSRTTVFYAILFFLDCFFTYRITFHLTITFAIQKNNIIQWKIDFYSIFPFSVGTRIIFYCGLGCKRTGVWDRTVLYTT